MRIHPAECMGARPSYRWQDRYADMRAADLAALAAFRSAAVDHDHHAPRRADARTGRCWICRRQPAGRSPPLPGHLKWRSSVTIAVPTILFHMVVGTLRFARPTKHNAKT